MLGEIKMYFIKRYVRKFITMLITMLIKISEIGCFIDNIIFDIISTKYKNCNSEELKKIIIISEANKSNYSIRVTFFDKIITWILPILLAIGILMKDLLPKEIEVGNSFKYFQMEDEVYFFYVEIIPIIIMSALVIIACYSFLIKLNQIKLGVAKYRLKKIESYK